MILVLMMNAIAFGTKYVVQWLCVEPSASLCTQCVRVWVGVYLMSRAMGMCATVSVDYIAHVTISVLWFSHWGIIEPQITNPSFSDGYMVGCRSVPLCLSGAMVF